ncbi:structural maintenance of chromosomes protein 2-1 [Phtheirospermum japonicum]|uniref:Structural maintenance of chromosomes protein 2-1 n=1 Tax=Phtheirospermum japonicum TaxID=374723 RepID=A0A830BUC6_9LAMI|nr:structural maintenance of chromosomes protein 2-1 [Phtheirospermum japonicum]
MLKTRNVTVVLSEQRRRDRRFSCKLPPSCGCALTRLKWDVFMRGIRFLCLSLIHFIVVSLKECMFNNANVLFRTKFVDGVSTVQMTKQSKGEKAFCSSDCQYKQMMLEGDEILEPDLDDVYGTNS